MRKSAVPAWIDAVSTPRKGVIDRSHYQFIRPQGLLGVEIMIARQCQRLWRVFHSDYTICTLLNIGGAITWKYRRQYLRSEDGHVMLMEPGEVHITTGGTVSGPGCFSVVSIAPALVGRLAEAAGIGPVRHLQSAAVCSPELLSASTRYVSAEIQGASLLERQSWFVRCVELSFFGFAEHQATTRIDAPRQALRRARDYLHEHWQDDVSLDTLAEIAGLSRFHFLRAFKREFLLPPHSLQLSIRVERSRALLRAGIPPAAIEAGFSDQSHLIRHFRRAWDLTPGQYATMVRPTA